MENLVVTGGAALTTFIVAAIIVEALTESVKDIIPLPPRTTALIFGLVVCVLGNINLLEIAGIPLLTEGGLVSLPNDYAVFAGRLFGTGLTGIVVARGSGWTNDLLEVIAGVRKKTKTSKTPLQDGDSLTLSLESTNPDAGRGEHTTSVLPTVPSTTSETSSDEDQTRL